MINFVPRCALVWFKMSHSQLTTNSQTVHSIYMSKKSGGERNKTKKQTPKKPPDRLDFSLHIQDSFWSREVSMVL